ncbi:MAG: hypothetical protein D8M59_13330 [Planctomycetes bacterium]|nr:hypothetical protein [Planctomycetota bacterium]NOG54983.1 hypothetical protein [Planctomycetota bacterium]
MKKFTTYVLTLMVAIFALSSTKALAGDQDSIWEANANQNGTVLKAKYKESPDNGLVDQTLEVELNNAPPGVKVSVAINGLVIGSMTTDGFGRAVLRLDKFGQIPGPDGRPTGPRIETGDTIRVFRGNAGIEADFVQTQ